MGIIHFVGAYYDRRREECGLCDGYRSSLTGCHKCADAEEAEDRREEQIREAERLEQEEEDLERRSSEPCFVCGKMGTREEPLSEQWACRACALTNRRMNVQISTCNPDVAGEARGDRFFFEGEYDDALKKGIETARGWLKEKPANTHAELHIVSVSWSNTVVLDISGPTDVIIDEGGF